MAMAMASREGFNGLGISIDETQACPVVRQLSRRLKRGPDDRSGNVQALLAIDQYQSDALFGPHSNWDGDLGAGLGQINQCCGFPVQPRLQIGSDRPPPRQSRAGVVGRQWLAGNGGPRR